MGLARERVFSTASQVAPVVKNLAASAGVRDAAQSLGREGPLEAGTAAHSIFLSGESHGQRSRAGCSPWGCTESDTIG